MVKYLAIVVLLVISIAAVAFGMASHVRFIREGGQKGFRITASEQLSKLGVKAKRNMMIGYAIFALGVAAMLVISALLGSLR